MDVIRIAIVDDDTEDRNRLNSCLEQYMEETGTPLVIRGFKNGELFLESPEDFHLVFMDIEMPGRNGIEIAKVLRKRGTEEVLILVTNMGQYALYGYEVRAVDYILKPVAFQQLLLKMPGFLSMIKRNLKTVTIKNRDSLRKVSVREVRYIEVYNHTIVFHMTDRNEECHGALKDYEESLKDFGFVKCSQSCLVNLSFVDSIHQDMIFLGQEKLQISRREKKAFLSSFAKFDGGYGV